ncbi:hypothetical protein MG293_010472 [Ovis ammon polii]|uniref:Uncharacterized protein n=1 Tax=Ovis ammon polii TaxID=230172 RepID=A0AAD4Y623_OVIAM|nr:hypothetical protein MG293_010472 [Ovis ammon polii]
MAPASGESTWPRSHGSCLPAPPPQRSPSTSESKEQSRRNQSPETRERQQARRTGQLAPPNVKTRLLFSPGKPQIRQANDSLDVEKGVRNQNHDSSRYPQPYYRKRRDGRHCIRCIFDHLLNLEIHNLSLIFSLMLNL